MAVENLITEHIDIWMSAVKTRSTSGRGSSKKLELYGIKKLRELILELAVRGKLVPQDPNDEPASIHLKRIAEVKSELISNKAIRKAKVAKQSDMPPANFETPKGWSAPILENLVINSSDNIVDGPFGSKLKATEYVDSGVPIIRIQNVDRNQFKNNGLQYLTAQKAEELHRHSFVSGDIVINKLGEPTGKACIVPQQLEYGIVVADIVRIRLDSEVVNEHYLTLAINSPFVANQFSGLAKGVTRQRVNLSQIRSLTIPVPPLKEQERIKERFNKLMALCDQLEQQTETSIEAHQVLVTTLLDTLTNSADADELMKNWARISEHFDTLFTTEASIDQLKQTILQLAVMGKLVPQDPSDEPAAELLKRIAEEKAQLVKEKKIKKPKAHITFEGLDDLKTQIPSGWHWIRLSDTAELVRGGSPRPAGDPRFYDGEIPFLKVGDVTRKSSKFVEGYNATIKEAGLNKTRLIETRTVLLSNSGATLGIPAICEFPATFNDGIAAFIEKSKYIYDEYLYLYLSTKTKWFLDIASRGQGQPNLNTDIIKATWFPLAPFEEQYRIVCKVDELLSICEHLKKQILESQATQLHLTDSIVDKAVKP
ncbi:restriction endonuclease subunit S [Vibrio cincinnatiensis]|uniref:restriction endonuclease subunit S n=1 Tax=Vibrio cincinnatiensis TaxID=675 RepID=UPI001EDEC01D|nr:restriction endonuclease subunit S [Vibrio cincinnatiensis]MCG3767588.1 restriction endonuclease subunit S [Vibrio cincinnatiensis]